MEEMSLDALNMWFAETFESAMSQEQANALPLNLAERLSDQEKMDYMRYLTGVVGDSFYAKHSPAEIQANPDLTYSYYWEIAEASREAKLKALYQLVQLRS